MAQPDEYKRDAGVFQKSMEETMAHLDQLKEEVLKAKEQAIDQEIAARDELARIKREAEKLAEQFIESHQKEYDQRVKKDTLLEVTKKLLRAARSTAEIKRWLDVPPEMISDALFYLGFEMLKGKPANVTYEQQGRTGYVYFNWDGIVLRFYYEFGGGDTLAIIDIPPADKWVEQTGIALDDRDVIVDFVAHRILRDQAPNYKFEIKEDYIRVYQ